jgi:tetratricopeptide (TPR) repeat protein
MATAFDGRDSNIWRMLSRAYERLDRGNEAEAAAAVSENVDAAEAGNADAERRLQDAAQVLTVPEVRAEVTSELGRIAEARGDFASASARFAQAYSLRERSGREGEGVVAEAVRADAQMLVRSLDRAGRTREACERLRQAQEAHDVAAPDQDLLDRCRRQYRVPLRERVELAPRLRTSEPAPTPAPEQRSAPY